MASASAYTAMDAGDVMRKASPPPSFVACHLALVVVVVVVAVAVAVVGGRRVGTMRRCTDAPMRRCAAAVRLARPSACPWTAAAVLQGPPASRASAQSGNGAMVQWCNGTMVHCSSDQHRVRRQYVCVCGDESPSTLARIARRPIHGIHGIHDIHRDTMDPPGAPWKSSTF